jgi:hypothetical protein
MTYDFSHLRPVMKIIGFLAFALALFAVPQLADASTLYVSPASGNYSVGSTFTVSIRPNTQGSSVNTAEANITYSADTLELVSASQGSTFYLPAPGSPTKGNGTAYLGGGVPTPGYSGSAGTLGSLTFRARAEGTGTVTVSSGKVLLNDGFGTDSLIGRSGATFTIGAAAQPTQPTGGTGAPEVTSTTHPDQSAWYKANTVALSWSRPSGAHGFSFELDQKPDTSPDNTLDTTITTQKSYPDLANGVWYFHIKARGQSPTSAFGATRHFKISVDAVPPKPFDINIEGTGADMRVTFGATDELSGIQRYDLYEGQTKIKENVQSPLDLSVLGNGTRNIRIVAIDKAWNEAVASATIAIEGATGAGIFDWLKTPIQIPLYILLLFNLLLMLIILCLLFLLLKKREDKKSVELDIGALKAEIDEALDGMKRDINKKISGLKADSQEELDEKEQELTAEVKDEIGETMNKIDNKIVKVAAKRRSKKK